MSKGLPAVLLAAGLRLLLGAPAARADSVCATCAPATKHCPPKYIHYAEGPPNLKFKKACPRPVCDPCHLEQYGYYPTCWQPWAFGPNYGHCVAPHTGAMLPPPAMSPYAPRDVAPPALEPERAPSREPDLGPPPRKPSEPLPPPRKLDDKPIGVRLLLPPAR